MNFAAQPAVYGHALSNSLHFNSQALSNLHHQSSAAAAEGHRPEQLGGVGYAQGPAIGNRAHPQISKIYIIQKDRLR